MRRALLITGLVAAVLVPSARAADKPPLAAKVTVCQTGETADARAAEFTASMPAIARTQRMQMRFVLLQRRGTKGKFRGLDVPDWGSWEKTDPGRAGFVFTKRIEGLLAPAAYRAKVFFRWYDKRGSVLRQATRTTPACEQPDLRPDLQLERFDAAVKGDGASYTVVVRNAGKGTAAPSAVEISFGPATLGPVQLGAIAAGDSALGALSGPRCTAGQQVTIHLDAADA